MNNYDNLQDTNLQNRHDSLLFWIFLVKILDGRILMRILFQHFNQFVDTC